MAVVEADGANQASLLSGLSDFARLLSAYTHGLFDPEGLAGSNGGEGDFLVEEVRGSNRNDVYLRVC